MIAPARRICFDLLSRIEARRVFSDDALNSDVMKTVDVRDRHLITEIVYGTLRRQSLLDHILAGASSKPWQDVDMEARVLLRMSLYQLWYMDRIPDHALVNDAVELGKVRLKRGVDRYLNGVLRHLARSRPWEDPRDLENAPQWVQVSLPRWLWKRWSRRFGEAIALEYAESLNNPPSAALRLGADYDVEALPFRVRASDIVPGAYIRDEKAEEWNREASMPLPFQDEASQLIPHLLGDIRGCTLWDACAAPGGKTAVLCDAIGESGMVVASDRSLERVCRLKNLSEYRRKEALLLVADACLRAPFRGYFDAIVADVPCSGLGTLRRNPEIKWRFRSSDLALLQKNQRSILEAVSENVREGGRLLYATCSTEPEENEQVVESFLADHPDFHLGRPVAPAGIAAWICNDHMVRTFPTPYRWDGFFAALMWRRSG